MLDEIIPALKPFKRSKVLSAESTKRRLLPVIDQKISFGPFVAYLKTKRTSVPETSERLYNYIINKFEAEPSLLKPIDNMGLIDEHAELMELITTSLFPVIGNQQRNCFALAAPYEFSVFYYSDPFQKLFFDNKEQHLLLPDGIPSEELKAVLCGMIYDQVLEKFYGVKLNEHPELVYPVCDPQTGMMRYYKIRYDRRFIDLHAKDELPPLKECSVCMNTFRILNLEKQLETMPLHLFEAEGFAVWVAEDITNTEAIESIRKILLRQKDCDATAIEAIRKAVKTLIGMSEVDVGLMPFIKINNQFVLDKEMSSHGLLVQQWLNDDPESLSQFRLFTNFVLEHMTAVPITILNKEIVTEIPFLAPVFQNGARSFLVYPMQNCDGLIGLLELSSPTQNALTHDAISKLEPAIPLLSLAMLKRRDHFHEKIEKVIREKFTALQSSVEWKFAEVAWDYLRQSETLTITKNVAFENVYPLYGAIDIRNSSLERSHAIQKDLKQHLVLVEDTLKRLQSIIQLPLLEGLEFKNSSLKDSIELSLTAEEEIRINEFLGNEVEPVFQHLRKSNDAAQQIVDDYCHTVKNYGSYLYRHRHEYEETVARINDAVLSYLEKEEELVQKSYPHYFEKYRTDGIEYNIYIGQSIAPNYPFDLLYLKNIRLWQLRSMAEAAQVTHSLLPQLKVPLQTTQLILIHNQPITISFRRDERKFDVEGSYNIRYEIIKKRLDKVHIRDTHERLTQPGKIALVYSNQKEAQEYEEYLLFVQKKNVLKPGIELLELEELQGVKGLKALRVEINFENHPV